MTGMTSENYLWLYRHGVAAAAQFKLRNGVQHMHHQRLVQRLAMLPLHMRIGQVTPFAQAMSPQYRRTDAVSAYRLYYLNEQVPIARWNVNVGTPEWWVTGRRRMASVSN